MEFQVNKTVFESPESFPSYNRATANKSLKKLVPMGSPEF